MIIRLISKTSMMKLFSANQLVPINILLLILFLHCSCCHSLTTISTNQPLKDGDVLLSTREVFALGFFTPSNNSKNRYVGIWYHNVPKQTVVWVANRDNPLNDSSGVFSINTHGNLVLNHTKNQNLNTIWSSNVSDSFRIDIFAELLDSGNLVLRDSGGRGKVLWQSFDYPSDTQLPFAKLGLDRKSGLNRILTSWKSLDDPSFGSVTMRIDPTGYPQAFMYKNGDPFWRVGSWTGYGWSGIAAMKPDPVQYVVFTNNADEVTVMNVVKILKDPATFQRLVLDETGRISRNAWRAQENRWVVAWYGPADECDRYRRCGSNSICDPYKKEKLECVCLPGFEPKNLRDGSKGCMRKKNVSTCQSGEGFVKVAYVKVPETSKAQVDNNKSMSLDDCKEKCLKNCSCTAYTSVNRITHIGCLTWHSDDMEDIRAFNGIGQDFYVRVDAVELAKYERKPFGSLGKKGFVTVIVVSLFLFILVATSFLYWFVKKPRHAKGIHSNYELDELDREGNSDVPFFNLSDIIEATNNFSIANKIGQGGFGFVYKGLLNNGMEIAVKKLSKYAEQSIEGFKTEVAVIAKLQHRNLVRILGCCIQGEDHMLIYEYLPNKSLDSFIFDVAKKLQLDWRKRFDIICGIARGILYLHQDSRLRIIHRDLKASNILLDFALNPKITDFGMARIFGGDQIQANTEHVVGTYGYMSPEYAMEGLFSIKSDVYSFGVLLLEIVTSRKNSGYYDGINSSLVKHVWDLWKEARAMEIVDPSIKCETCLEHEVVKCIQIGLLCVQEYASDRPTILEVVSMLENGSTLHPPKPPAFVFKKTTSDHSNQATVIEEFTCSNEMSTTLIEAR